LKIFFNLIINRSKILVLIEVLSMYYENPKTKPKIKRCLTKLLSVFLAVAMSISVLFIPTSASVPADSPAPESDATAPVLSAGSVERYSDKANIYFTASEGGGFYSQIKNSGDPAPGNDIEGSDWERFLNKGVGGKISVHLPLTDGAAKDIYIVVKGVSGNVSDPLKISVEAYKETYITSIAGVAIGDETYQDAGSYDNFLASINVPYSVASISASDIIVSGGTFTIEDANGKAISLTAGTPTNIVICIQNGQTKKYYTITVTREIGDDTAPTVTSVSVSPEAVEVQKGTTQTFIAAVSGTNSPGQGVTWTVLGGTASSIDSSGVLTVSADETATALLVTATSTVDTSKYGTAMVMLTAKANPNTNPNPTPTPTPKPTPAPKPEPTPAPTPAPSPTPALPPEENPYVTSSMETRQTENGTEYTTASGAKSTVTQTADEGVKVEAGLNKSGSVNSQATAAAVAEAAAIAQANGETAVKIELPEGTKGISKQTVEKLLNAAGDTAVVLDLPTVINGETVGSVSVPLTSDSGQILTGMTFDTSRTKSVEEYITKKWDTTILGSFETAQKGGWGEKATLSISTEKLGFAADNETSLTALIYDTKAKKWYQVSATVEDGNIIIKTKRTGIITIVTDPVKK
jgi:outer membrane biosynthesis protein TonB